MENTELFGELHEQEENGLCGRKHAGLCDLHNVSGSALNAVKQIPQVPQTQMALNDQLKILRIAANKLGLYDAADFIKRD
jgi:hypothetical protein